MYDVIIIGSGLAGLTAAIYTSRGNLKTLVVAGSVHGGQLMLTTDVENYPGFPEGILGPDLMERTRRQAERFGAEMLYDDITSMDFSNHPFRVWVGQKDYLGRSVIIATGASAKWLGLEGEQRLIGRGVSSCATCDGFFFKGKDVVVVGGGNTAMEDSLHLAKLVKKVTVVHRRDKLRATKILQQRAFNTSNIHFVWNSIVTGILGADKVEGVKIRNVQNGTESMIPCSALFVAIGHEPNTKVLQGWLDLDERGYIRMPNDSSETNIKGVFAAGDVHDHRYRQAVTAAGFGCRAAMDAEAFLESLKDNSKAILAGPEKKVDRQAGN